MPNFLLYRSMQDSRTPLLAFVTVVTLSVGTSSISCSGTNGSDGTGGNGPSLGAGGNVGLGSSGTGSTAGAGVAMPSDYTKATVGGWKVGDPITSDTTTTTTPDPSGCGAAIISVIRDFKADGQSFESSNMGDDRGVVETTLGTNRKPVYAHTGQTSTIASAASFNQFYRTVTGVNMAYQMYIWFSPFNGTSSFQSTSYFPLDGMGFGNQGNPHNFHFTTEIHSNFEYKGGEKFTFIGDDDVWVFINNQLALDLGGVHSAETKEIDIDTLGLTVGQVYPFDMFQAERHTVESNFRADTNLAFTNCGVIVPDVPLQ